MTLLNLPVTILSEILTHLDYLDILPLSAVCKHLRALAASSLILQYRLELEADGLVDGPPAARAPRGVASDAPTEAGIGRAGGALPRVRARGGPVSQGAGGVWAARRLVASWLPSNSAGETRLVVDDLGVRIKDFALDPTQDLIVLLEHRPAVDPITSTSSSAAAADIRVHLRKLSGGVVAPHPAAKASILCRHGLGPVHGCMIQIVEDVVGMYFWMPFHGVLIWNWMTGEELVFTQENQVPERIWDFSFLSPRAYMVTTLKDGGEIRIYSFANTSFPNRPTHVATLHLPLPHNHRVLLELTTTTGPFLAWPPANAPFASARNARVHVFTLHHDPVGHRGRWQPACFVVHNRTLMQYVEAYEEEAGAADVPWEEWGPHGTRFFVLAMGFQWLRYVHGTRVVCPVLQPTGECRIKVLDFNAHASRPPTAAERVAARHLGIDPEQPPEGAKMVCEPSVFAAGMVFAKEVVTALPYYTVPAPGQGEPYVGYMVDEQRLLGLKASPFTDVDLGDVDVYTF
ncbi:hypothetical protein BC827DRAFT_1383685 [Russula dissimulans]|nr:hypothetical protein BC827DRAFT_1383685 [Russula dissimulans]